MTVYCKKLNAIFPEMDMSKIIGGPLVEGYSETFRSWNIHDLEYFNQMISTVIKFNIPPDVSTYTEISGDGAEPHSEALQTILNYYIDPGKCLTCFWELKDPNMPVETLPRLTDAGEWVSSAIKTYDPTTLVCKERFLAKPNEAWLLSTGSIHSLSKPITADIRKFFRLGWSHYNVEQVFDSIEIL